MKNSNSRSKNLFCSSLLLGVVAWHAKPASAQLPLPDSYAQENSLAPGPGASDCDSVFWRPLASFLLPGLGQFVCNQYASGLAYSGVALTGLGLNNYYTSQLTEEEIELTREAIGSDEQSNKMRAAQLGLLAFQGAGGLSAYHSFRTSVRNQIRDGHYSFLRHEETTLDILKAPFDFSYLTRSSTWIPLLGLGALAVALPSLARDEFEYMPLSRFDVFYNSALSFNAGTHEEALFRGWLMPALNEEFQSPFWANASTAVLFAAAHLGTNSFPLPQLLLGYYLGSVVQNNQWRVGEAVFIHTWWDIIALFGARYRPRDENGTVQRVFVRLPTVAWTF